MSDNETKCIKYFAILICVLAICIAVCKIHSNHKALSGGYVKGTLQGAQGVHWVKP